MKASNTICSHIGKYYPPPTSSDPPIYWEINHSLLPQSVQLERTPSQTGDNCHYNLRGLDDKAARQMLVTANLSEFMICANGVSRNLAPGDMEK